jgi:hypothetical protein
VLHSIPFLSTKGINMATLGISTNTRLLGLAIIHQGRLLDYSIRLDKSPWSPSKATRIITSLEPCVRQYCIKKVVLSMPYHYHQTDAFKMVYKALKQYCNDQQINLQTQPAESFYSLGEEKEKRSKKAVMYAIVQQFPQLTYCFQKEMRSRINRITKKTGQYSCFFIAQRLLVVQVSLTYLKELHFINFL